jgi:hypothetical protein
MPIIFPLTMDEQRAVPQAGENGSGDQGQPAINENRRWKNPKGVAHADPANSKDFRGKLFDDPRTGGVSFAGPVRQVAPSETPEKVRIEGVGKR